MTGGDTTERRTALASQGLFVVLVLLVPFGFASLPTIFNDGDVSWHVAAGQWILDHRALPHADPFSLTAGGRPWVPLEWLPEVIYALAWRAAGHAGLAAVGAAALMALHGVVFVHLRTRAAPPAIVAALLLMDVALATFTLARPHVLVWPLLAAWTALLARSAESGRPPPLAAALLLVLWTNLHGSFPLAAIIAAPLAFDALVKAKWATLKQWLIFAAASFVALCLNANGLDGLLHPLRIAQLTTLHLILEWQPSTPGATPLFYAVLAAGLAALLWRGARLPPGRLVLLLALLLMAFSQVRHQSWFVIVAALLVPPVLGGTAEPARRLVPLALLALPLLLLRAALPITPVENSANPVQLIAAIAPDLRDKPVFNGYSMGGPLILAGIKPYIDGRQDLYGDAFFADYSAIADGDFARFNRAVARYGIRWTILGNGNRELIGELDRSGEWRRVYADKVGVIHVRREAPSASAARPGSGAISPPEARPAQRPA
ncbi:MAG TPA: hypothetical protein VF079_03745 [Sphingomicrobium sp.]